MAKTDLTFAELNAALGGNALTYSGDDILISVKAVTGDPKASIDSEGVIETMYKLRSACSVAQDTANERLPIEEQLSSFPGFSFSPPANGFVSVTQSQTVLIPLNTAAVIGSN